MLAVNEKKPLPDVNRWHRDARCRQAQEFYEGVAVERDMWKRRNWYYYRELENFYRSVIPIGSKVIEIGCGNGSLLAALQPETGVGIDWSPTSISQAKERYPHLRFYVSDAEQLDIDERFDYVILSDLLGELVDIQRSLERIHRVCHQHTRIVITDYSYLWEPALRIAQTIGWGMKRPTQNWLPVSVIREVLQLSGFDVVQTSGRVLLPVYIPVISPVINRIFARLPLIRRLCLVSTVVARPRWTESEELSRVCSVVVPCRNERGTIEAIVQRTPLMGKHTEIIFVDGHSVDGTVDEIKRVIREYPEKDIKLFHQNGTGKGDAVRQGFSEAAGDILMILDADMTVAPEELPKFYRCLASGYGEFVNGTRLVYSMDGQAMQLLNLMANKFFSALFTYLLGQELHDTLCGTKVLWCRDYEKIVAGRVFLGHYDPFGDFDLLFGASRLNLQIREIPVRYSERVYGQTNIRRFTHGWQLLKMCWVALWRLKFVP